MTMVNLYLIHARRGKRNINIKACSQTLAKVNLFKTKEVSGMMCRPKEFFSIRKLQDGFSQKLEGVLELNFLF